MLDCMQNGRSGPGGSAKAEAPVLYILSGNMIWSVSMQEDKPGTGKARALLEGSWCLFCGSEPQHCWHEAARGKKDLKARIQSFFIYIVPCMAVNSEGA